MALPDPLTGLALDQALATVPDSLPPLVEEFLYEDTVTILSAEPECGKTVLAQQINAAVAGGHPLWDKMPVPTPRRVYYLQLEGSTIEFRQHLALIRAHYPFPAENFVYDPYCEGVNMLDGTQQARLMERLALHAPFALLTIDPAYMAVKGGLSKDEPATLFTNFSNQLKQRFRCANLILHHNRRRTKDQNGRYVEDDDPFYGSQWLKAHADAFYYVSRPSQAHQYVRLTLSKDRNRNLRKTLLLHYRPESSTNYLEEVAAGSYLDKLVDFLHLCKKESRDTEAHEILAKTGMTQVTLKRLKKTQVICEMVEFVNSDGRKSIWKVK